MCSARNDRQTLSSRLGFFGCVLFCSLAEPGCSQSVAAWLRFLFFGMGACTCVNFAFMLMQQQRIQNLNIALNIAVAW